MTVALACSSFIASLFGMNLTTYLENDPYAFAFVTTIATSLAVVVLSVGMLRLRKAGRMVLYGTHRH